MKCPACIKPLAVDSGPLPSSHSCPSCKGHWVPYERFEAWLGAGAAGLRSGAVVAPPVSRRAKARLCPRCERIVAPARLSNTPQIEVERCGTCNGVWFDGAEMEWAAGTGMLARLYHVLNDSGQRRLDMEREAAEHENRVRAVLGDDVYAEAARIKAWLDAQPQRATIMAVLMGQTEGYCA
ncbi:MAG TPA: zf-TFIIB domain-containing protein [Phycisphaerales bacterium]|nr:zf-TFIIB domain-containing protein [Phycisphaerales bacterium]